MIYQSGVVPDGTPVTSIDDPDLWLLRDCMFDAQSKPVVNFWQAANTNGFELPPLLTFNTLGPALLQEPHRTDVSAVQSDASVPEVSPRAGHAAHPHPGGRPRCPPGPRGLEGPRPFRRREDADVRRLPSGAVHAGRHRVDARIGRRGARRCAGHRQVRDESFRGSPWPVCQARRPPRARRRRRSDQLPTQNVNVVVSVTDPDVALMYSDQTPPMKK